MASIGTFVPSLGGLVLLEQEVLRLWRWGLPGYLRPPYWGFPLFFLKFPGRGPLPVLGAKVQYPFSFLRMKSEVPEGAKVDAHSGVGRDRFLGQLG